MDWGLGFVGFRVYRLEGLGFIEREVWVLRGVESGCVAWCRGSEL